MQKVIVQVDWYTKIVLTLIAVLLAGLLAKPYVVSRPASGAYGQRVIVDNEYPIPVKIEGVGSKVTGALPVEVVSATIHQAIPVEVINKRIHIDGEVSAYISTPAVTVVDWNEKDDYYDYLRKQWKKRE